MLIKGALVAFIATVEGMVRNIFLQHPTNPLNLEGVVTQGCNLLTLQPEQSGGVALIPGRVPHPERHDKGRRLEHLATSKIPALCA